jgi:hypothetical protein
MKKIGNYKHFKWSRDRDLKYNYIYLASIEQSIKGEEKKVF